MYSTDHTIMRNVPASGRVSHRLERKPVRVATMIDEKAFVDMGNCLVHNKTVFLEDRTHDWDYKPLDRSQPDGPGDFYYYTRVAQCADVLLVFAFTKEPPVEAIKFDPQTGQPVTPA